jgi:hypothetical protein
MKYFLLVGLCLYLFACNTGSQSEPGTLTDTASNAEPFYPITQYIQEQLAYVDTMPLAIEKQTFVNSVQVDSMIIDRPAFHQLAADFLYPDLNDAGEKKNYRESKFQDLTINTLTFSYNALRPDAELQQKDILLDPETQKVKNVLFRKVLQHGDTVITMNGIWKHNYNFQINYILEPKNGPMQTKQVKVIWDRPINNY